MQKILVIDDDRDMCMLLNRFLSKQQFEVQEMYNGKKALDWLSQHKPDLILSDFRLEDMDGKQLLTRSRELYPDVPFIIITGYSDVKLAVEVLKLGAFDYVTKPVFPDEILITIRKALATPAAVHSSSVSPRERVTPVSVSSAKKIDKPVLEKYIWGNTPEMRNILKQIELVSPTNYSVIIYGESGSGKEAIASKIHEMSKRRDKPFIAIDCGALSKELAGSELFGHEKGSFTGALNQKVGSLELADGGTVFLDEIANLPYDIQVSLLRVVQERKIRRVGGNKDIELDLRIIVASNEKLWNKCKTGAFREDLYHRFNEFSIELPALRQRADDIPLFCAHFLQLANQQLNKNIEGFTDECMEVLLHYSWPGNLRELQNTVKRAALLTEGNRIELKSIPFEIVYANQVQFDAKPAIEGKRVEQPPGHFTSLKASSIDYEYELIQKTLRENNFNKSKTARVLNIDRKTLYNKIAIYEELLTKKQRAHD